MPFAFSSCPKRHGQKIFLEMTTLLLPLLVLCRDFVAGFDFQRGNVSISLSEAAYCGVKDYFAYPFDSTYVKGFQISYEIFDDSSDTHGFIGYLPSMNTIYVSFRGSESISKWITNIDAIKKPYPPCESEGCEVHKGFYLASETVKSQIVEQVQELVNKYPSANVEVTGHSLGAALSTFTCLNLIEAGISKATLFNFGSPRLGNAAFAEWASGKIPSNRARVTHHKDMVVHTPPENTGFEHISNEFYGDPVLSVKTCSGNEDPTCSDQWHFATSIDDHLLYLGLPMGTDGCA